MKITKKSFIIAGILLWGIPCGILVPLVSAVLKPGTLLELHAFQSAVFFKNLVFFLPAFMGLGIFAGLILFKISRKYLD